MLPLKEQTAAHGVAHTWWRQEGTSVAAVLATVTHLSFPGTRRSRMLSPGSRELQTPSSSRCGTMRARAGGLRPAPLVEVSGLLGRFLRQENEDMALSLDVPALQMVEEMGPRALGWVLDLLAPLFPETTQYDEENLTARELKAFQEIPEVQVVERPRPSRAAQTVALPKTVLLDGIPQRGRVQTVDNQVPQVGRKRRSASRFTRNAPDCIVGVTESGKRLDWARPSCSFTGGAVRWRFRMRQQKTMKIVATGSEKSWMWMAFDCCRKSRRLSGPR